MDEKENKKIDTVKNAIDYIDTPASNVNNWKIKDLGLQFLLFGIAEIQAKRVAKLVNRIGQIEDLVFDETNLLSLDPRSLMEAYKLSATTFRDITDFISKTRKEMNWEEISSRLHDMSLSGATETTDEASIAKIANKLLEAMKPTNTHDRSE